jgi:hypothetical protein
MAFGEAPGRGTVSSLFPASSRSSCSCSPPMFGPLRLLAAGNSRKAARRQKCSCSLHTHQGSSRRENSSALASPVLLRGRRRSRLVSSDVLRTFEGRFEMRSGFAHPLLTSGRCPPPWSRDIVKSRPLSHSLPPFCPALRCAGAHGFVSRRGRGVGSGLPAEGESAWATAMTSRRTPGAPMLRPGLTRTFEGVLSTCGMGFRTHSTCIYKAAPVSTSGAT